MSKKSIRAAEVVIDGETIPAKWDSKAAGSSVCSSARLKFDPPRLALLDELPSLV